MKKLNLNPILVIGVVVLLVLLLLEKCGKDNRQDKQNLQLITALQDSVRYFKNKDSLNVATISVIQTASAKDFANLELKDKELKELQKVVNDYKKDLKEGSSVTNALLETVAELKGRKPEIKYMPGDTLWKDSVAYVYPTYTDSLSDAWVTVKAVMGKDTSVFNLKVTNKFSAVVGKDRKRGPFVDLITENPYTTVKSLRTYQVSLPRPKKFGIGFSTGVTYNFSTSKPAPYIGVGINYNLIRL